MVTMSEDKQVEAKKQDDFLFNEEPHEHTLEACRKAILDSAAEYDRLTKE